MTLLIYPILYFVQIASVVEKIEDLKDISTELSEKKSSGRQEDQVIVEERLAQEMEL